MQLNRTIQYVFWHLVMAVSQNFTPLNLVSICLCPYQINFFTHKSQYDLIHWKRNLQLNFCRIVWSWKVPCSKYMFFGVAWNATVTGPIDDSSWRLPTLWNLQELRLATQIPQTARCDNVEAPSASVAVNWFIICGNSIASDMGRILAAVHPRSSEFNAAWSTCMSVIRIKLQSTPGIDPCPWKYWTSSGIDHSARLSPRWLGSFSERSSSSWVPLRWGLSH
jgi:hypothetical protein